MVGVERGVAARRAGQVGGGDAAATLRDRSRRRVEHQRGHRQIAIQGDVVAGLEREAAEAGVRGDDAVDGYALTCLCVDGRTHLRTAIAERGRIQAYARSYHTDSMWLAR